MYVLIPLNKFVCIGLKWTIDFRVNGFSCKFVANLIECYQQVYVLIDIFNVMKDNLTVDSVLQHLVMHLTMYLE